MNEKIFLIKNYLLIIVPSIIVMSGVALIVIGSMMINDVNIITLGIIALIGGFTMAFLEGMRGKTCW